MKQLINNRIAQINARQVPEGYMQTNICCIPVDWSVGRLSDLFERLYRKNNIGNKNVLTVSAQYGLINQEDFFNKEIASEVKTNYFLLNKGDFAYNKSYSTGYPYGAIKILEKYDQGILSPLYICFSAKAETNREFYKQYFDSQLYNHEIYRIAQEGARNHGLLNMSVDDFFNIRLPNPPPKEQQKIAEILGEWDRAIEIQEKLVMKLEERKKNLLQILLTPKKNWEKKHINEVCKITTGKLDANAMVTNGKYRFYTCAKEYYLIDNYSFDTEALLISGNGANVGYIHHYAGKFNAYQRTYVLTDFTTNIIFLKYFLECNLSRRINEEVNEGNTPYIVLNTIAKMMYKYPESFEQEKIIRVLSTQDNQLCFQRQQLQKLKLQKQALMQLLLTGIVRVKV